MTWTSSRIARAFVSIIASSVRYAPSPSITRELLGRIGALTLMATWRDHPMKSYPRDWIAWSIVAALLIVATVEVVSSVKATRVSSVVEDGGRAGSTDLV